VDGIHFLSLPRTFHALSISAACATLDIFCHLLGRWRCLPSLSSSFSLRVRSVPYRRPPKPKPRCTDDTATVGGPPYLGVALWCLSYPGLLAHGVRVHRPHRIPLLQISPSHSQSRRRFDLVSHRPWRARILCGHARTCSSDPTTHSSDLLTRSSDPRGDGFWFMV
jgi:hypothetical protein